MELKKIMAKSASGNVVRSFSIMVLTTLSIGLTACGGGGGGGGGTVTNNGSISNPQNYTMPAGGVATVPPTTN